MPTAIGLIFIAVTLYFFLRKPDHLFGLLLFSTVFPSTSVINFGSLWIIPYYFIAPVFIFSQLLRRRIHGSFRGSTLLISFVFLGALSAIICPLIFTGMPVYSERLGSSDDVFQTFPLVFSIGNIAQAGYLVTNALVVLAAASALKSDSVWKGLQVGFYAITGTIAVELGCLLASIQYPYTIIENIPDQSALQGASLDPTARLHGTCSESSTAGLILLVFFALYFYRYYIGRGDGVKALISGVALLLVRSSSALVVLATITVLIPLFNLPVRVGMGSFRIRQLSRAGLVALIVGGALSLPVVQGIVQDWVLDKASTGSYEHRNAMDRYAEHLVMETYGIGVGIGSYRPSSLVASLFGNVGVLGTLLFGMMLFRIVMVVPKEVAWWRWAIFAVVVDMALGGPDITQPMLWALLGVAVHFSVQDSLMRRSRYVSGGHRSFRGTPALAVPVAEI